MYDDMSRASYYRSVYNPSFLAKADRKEAEKRRQSIAAAEARERALALEQAASERRKQVAAIKAKDRLVVSQSEAKRRAARSEFNPEIQALYDKLEARACKAFKVFPFELLGKSRVVQLATARQFLCYWLCRLTNLSLPEIGRLINRDHTTILWGKDAYPEKRAKMGRALRAAR